MKNKLILVAIGLIGTVLAGYFYAHYRIAPQINCSSVPLTDLNGHPRSLDGFRGKKLFINFMATWCGPCLRELPSMEQAQSILAEDDFQFILISDEPLLRLRSFQQQAGKRFLVLHCEKSLSELKIFTLPTSYVLNGKGEIVMKKTGEADWGSKEMIEKIKKNCN